MELIVLVELACVAFVDCLLYFALQVVLHLLPVECAFHSVVLVVGAWKSVQFALLLALAFEHVGLKSAMICELLTAILAIDTVGFIGLHLPMKKGSIHENIVSHPMSFAVIELAYKNSPILEIHRAEPMRLNFLLRIIKILHNWVNLGRYHGRSVVCLRYGKARHGRVGITTDAARPNRKVVAIW